MSLSERLPPPSRIVIVADDLTSATDCGVQMMTGGHRTVIPLRPDCEVPEGAGIVALDSDSRDLSPQAAYGATRDAFRGFGPDPGAAVYKSIDSTLRGNLGAELDAILDAGGFDAAVIAPAFPTYGRTTRNGRQFLDGRPLDETEFASDPTAPVTSAEIAVRFAEQSRRRAALVPLDLQRAGRAAVLDVLRQRRRAGDELFICDAMTEEDLEALAGLVGGLPGRFLWVGSTGLSRYVPAAVGLKPQGTRRVRPAAAGCVLVVAGSASETTRAQLDLCVGKAGFVEIQVDSRAIAKGGDHERDELDRVGRLLEAAVEGSVAVALTLTAGRDDIAATRALATRHGRAADRIETDLARILGRLTAELLESGAKVKGLVLTGGTTAKMTVSQLHADLIEILDEIEPGIPLGRMSGRGDLLVVTKAGGFGGPRALLESVERIARHGQD